MAKFSGDGSYERIIANTYGIDTPTKLDRKYNEYNSDIEIRTDSIIIILPFSLKRAGWLSFNTGAIGNYNFNGAYWEIRANSITQNNSLYSTLSGLYYQNMDYKGNGFSVRCGDKICVLNVFMLI